MGPIRPIGPILFALAIAAYSDPAVPTKHEDWHKLAQAGAKMQIKCAGFFGAGGVETFAGVARLSNGDIAVFGNSWGPPFPDDPKATVMGSDHLVELTLHPVGLDKGGKGRPLPPPELHPNRTGFLVQYAPDLRRIVNLTRFGWGAATMDAGIAAPDGGLIVAGTASEHFESIAKSANAKRLPPPNDPARCFGPLVYEGVKMAGNVYVGKLKADRGGFDWLWVLEGFRRPPARIFTASDGGVVFESNYEVLRISANGATCVSLAVLRTPARGENVFLAGVGPTDGSLLVAGSRMHNLEVEAHLGARFSSVREPAIDLLAPDGKLASRLYNWPVALTANPRLQLNSACSIAAACFFPDGRLAFAGQALGTNTLLETNPADLTQRCRPGKFVLKPVYDPNPWGRKPPSSAQVVTVSPGSWSDSTCVPWVAMDGILPNEVTVRGILGMRDGRVALWGESGRWLLQTETNIFRACDHVQYARQDVRESTVATRASGKPKILALGGEGPFLTVFDPEFAGLAWSSALPGCRVMGVVELQDALAVVSTCIPATIPQYPETPPGMENRPPAAGTPWTQFGGGYSDGHIFILGGAK